MSDWTDWRNRIVGATVGTLTMGPGIGTAVGYGAGSAVDSATNQAGPAAPIAPPAPPNPNNSSDIQKAKEEQDERGSHGFAANILAGSGYQAEPMLAKNILLGN